MFKILSAFISESSETVPDTKKVENKEIQLTHDSEGDGNSILIDDREVEFPSDVVYFRE